MFGKLCFVLPILLFDNVLGSISNDILMELKSLKLEELEKSIRNQKYPPLPNSARLLQPLAGEAPDGECKSIFNCASCDTAQVCVPNGNGTFVPLTNTTCPKQTPYCNSDTGSCSSVPDKTCGVPDKFVCPSDGYFPDAVNCSIYHACNELKSNTFLCGSSIYDPDSSSCDVNALCHKANCSGISGKKIQIGSSHYFTYCITGKSVLVDRCPGDYSLNYTSQDCEAICTRPGIRTDYNDCTKYYKCSKIFLSQDVSLLVRKRLSCNPGLAFDPKDYMCVPKNQTSCQSDPPPVN